MRSKNPYDSRKEELAGQILHRLRKPEEVRSKDDRDMIIEKAEELAREVQNDS